MTDDVLIPRKSNFGLCCELSNALFKSLLDFKQIETSQVFAQVRELPWYQSSTPDYSAFRENIQKQFHV